MPLVEIRDFDALFDKKIFFFYQPVKSKQEAYEKLIEMSRIDATQKGIYKIFHIIKFIINSLV